MKPQKLTDCRFLSDHFFYFNLHKRLWSAKCGQSDLAQHSARSARYQHGGQSDDPVAGRVTGHVDTVLLFDVTCKVSEAGRLRVIREKRKNVHAGLVAKIGTINPAGQLYTTVNTWRIRYNPYDLPYFHNPDIRTEIRWCPVVWLGTKVLDSGIRVPTAYYAQYAYYVGDTVLLHFDDCEQWARESDYTGHIDRNDGIRLHFCDGRFDCSKYRGKSDSPDSRIPSDNAA